MRENRLLVVRDKALVSAIDNRCEGRKNVCEL